jgi:hypothetical protein
MQNSILKIDVSGYKTSQQGELEALKKTVACSPESVLASDRLTW